MRRSTKENIMSLVLKMAQDLSTNHMVHPLAILAPCLGTALAQLILNLLYVIASVLWW